MAIMFSQKNIILKEGIAVKVHADTALGTIQNILLKKTILLKTP